MSVQRLLQQAAAGNAGGGPVYVDDVFSSFLWKGDSGTQTINNGIDLSGEGGLVWIKGRNSSYDNALYDTVRGATKEMYSNKTDVSSTNSNALTSFNSNGFSIGSGPIVNNNLDSYVAWSFLKQPGFFDIQTYTGSGENGQTINHNLDAVPGMVIVKSVTTTGKWYVYHRSLASGKHLKLNSNNQESSDSNYEIGKTTCTSTQFSIDTGSEIDASGQTYAAYFFAHDDQRFGEDSDEAIIHCGQYTGNGTNDGVAVNVGFEPQWLMVKCNSTTADWFIFDNMRGVVTDHTPTANDAALLPNQNSSEADYQFGDFTQDGFRVSGNSNDFNGNGQTYIYMAIRRPNKPASEFAATDLFVPVLGSGTSGMNPDFITGFPVDMFIHKQHASTQAYLSTRLTQQRIIRTESTDAETSHSDFQFDHQNGVMKGGYSSSYQTYNFRRAKGFFDVACYKGTGSAFTVKHNLGVVPELMFLRSREDADSWVIWDTNADLSTSTPLFSDFTQARRYPKNSIDGTAPTASVFSVGSAGFSTNTNGTHYIALLFASVPGICKIGTYSGNAGSDVNVDCGFSSGARFVLIWKTTSSGPGWYIFDTVQGLVAGNDPYWLLGASSGQVTGTDYIDPLSSGFTITSSAPNAINPSAGTMAFLAIA